MAMAAELIDLMRSLTNIMEDESLLLVSPGRMAGVAELAAAKGRLVGQMEAELVRLSREAPDWLELISDETRGQLSEAARALQDASTVNVQVLERQIELSVDMMAAIAAEAQRATGKRNTAYGACGGMAGMSLPAPIAINARL